MCCRKECYSVDKKYLSRVEVPAATVADVNNSIAFDIENGEQ